MIEDEENLTEEGKDLVEILEDTLKEGKRKREKGIYPTPAARKIIPTTEEIAYIEPRVRKKEN